MIETKVPAYKWARMVKEIDGYQCAVCGSVVRLEAHHIDRQSDFPERAAILENGICLCFKCHRRLHSWDLVKDFRCNDIETIRSICVAHKDLEILLCDLKKKQAEKFKIYCESIGKTSNAVLRDYVLDCIDEKKTEIE